MTGSYKINSVTFVTDHFEINVTISDGFNTTNNTIIVNNSYDLNLANIDNTVRNILNDITVNNTAMLEMAMAIGQTRQV